MPKSAPKLKSKPRITRTSPVLRPGQVGGKLIRDVIQFMRKSSTSLPLPAHILIAVSGGSDSVALAHLLVHFGRKIIARDRITLLHINHQWRGKESQRDAEFIARLGRKWKVPVITRTLDPPKQGAGQSWEEEARTGRKKIFKDEAEKLNSIILTAHQADDLAETLLWRLFTGAAQTHGGGVRYQAGVEIRPFLKTRKSVLLAYLKEVGQNYHEDATNHSMRFLRARMRRRLMPAVEELFPRAVEHLLNLGLAAQHFSQYFIDGDPSYQLQSKIETQLTPDQILLKAGGLRARRSHLEFMLEKMIPDTPWQGELHLPGGWKLIRESSQKWVLEKIG